MSLKILASTFLPIDSLSNHILVIEFTSKSVLCKSMYNLGNVTDHGMLIYWLGGETRKHPEPG